MSSCDPYGQHPVAIYVALQKAPRRFLVGEQSKSAVARIAFSELAEFLFYSDYNHWAQVSTSAFFFFRQQE